MEEKGKNIKAWNKRRASVEMEILKHTIGAIIDEDPGIYPKAFVGKYDERTEYMNGWNDALIKHAEMEIDLLADLGIEVRDGENCLDPPIIDILR